MRFYYTSYWKSVDAFNFTLRGVIATRSGEVGTYFPERAEEQEEWKPFVNDPYAKKRSHKPYEFLDTLTAQSSGITHEYGPIAEIDSDSLEEALQEAYANVLERFGSRLTM